MGLPAADLQEMFGRIDIYLFDQLLKGRFVPGMRILDGGCRRNLAQLSLGNGVEHDGLRGPGSLGPLGATRYARRGCRHGQRARARHP